MLDPYTALFKEEKEMDTLDDDDLDVLFTENNSERERVKKEHEYLNKASSHPVRRQIVGQIGVFGATMDEIVKALNIDVNGFKYHADFLSKGDFIAIREGKYFLTDKGLDMLANIKFAEEKI